MMGILVREADADDAKRIRDVHLESIRQLAGVTYTVEQVSAWAHNRDPEEYPIESEKTWFLIAEDEDKIVGFGWMTPDAGAYLQSDVDGEITAIYALPEVVRRGVGSRIYEELEVRAVRNGIQSIGLWASLNSIPFYESHGYEPISEHVVEYEGGVELTVVEMVKRPLR